LLEGRSNSSKGAIPLIAFYNEMNEEQRVRFRDTAMIPDGVSFDIEQFEEFYEARKKLLTKKIKELLG
jgi:hypothetical protein